MVCKNHPNVNARRHCYHCKKAICPSCQEKAYHHIFCGPECIEVFSKKMDSQSADLRDLLSSFDQSLNEDLREYGDAIVVELAARIDSFEQKTSERSQKIEDLLKDKNRNTQDDSNSKNAELLKTLAQIERKIHDTSGEEADRLAHLKANLSTTRADIDESFKELNQKFELQIKAAALLLKRHQRHQSLKQKELTNQVTSRALAYDAKLIEISSHLEGKTKEATEKLIEKWSRSNRAQKLLAFRFEKKLNKEWASKHELIEESKLLQEIIAEQTKEKLEKQHSSLQASLTSQKELLQSKLEAIDTFLIKIKDHSSDRFEKNESLLLAQFDQAHQKQSDAVVKTKEWIESNATNVSQKLEEQNKKFSSKMDNLDEGLLRFSEEHRSILQQTQKLIEESEKRFAEIVNEASKNHTIQTEAMLSSLEKSYQNFEKNIRSELHQKTDILNRKWSDVMSAASMGAKSAGLDLKQDLHQRLKTDLQNLSLEHEQAFRGLVGTLKEGIQKRLSQVLSPWTGKLGLAISGLSLALMLMMPWLIHRMTSKIDQRTVSAAIDYSDRFKQIEDKLDLLANQKAGKETMVALAETKDVQAQNAIEKGLDITHANRGNVFRKEFSFSFDGGSNARAATAILDILKSRQLKSTMFLTGAFIDANPEIVARMAKDGHEAANHLLQHEHMIDPDSKKVLYSKERLLTELKTVESAYEKASGHKMTKIWRAPFGEINQEMILWAAHEGYTHVGWSKSGKISLDTLDWVIDRSSKLYRSPQGIMDHILKFEKSDAHGLNGAIVLMHLGSEREPDQMAHLKLPDLLDLAVSKGYKIVPVSRVLRSDVAKN